jgi:opacity protein-like surface antigen
VLSFTGTYRFNWWDKDDESLRQTLTGGRSRVKGFVEAEVGYWKESELSPELSPFESDLTVGVNAIAVYPTRHVDMFFGGGVGAHFLSESASVAAEESQGNQTKFGTNIQFGIDLNFTEPVAIFALGRYDILQGDILDFQSKILVGLRYKF